MMILGAVFCWGSAYLILKYRRNYAAWYARQGFALDQVWPWRRGRQHLSWSYALRYWEIFNIVGGAHLVVFGAGLWVGAVRQAIRLLRGAPEAAVTGAPVPPTPGAGSVAGGLLLLAGGLLFCAVGVLGILNREHAARLTHWQLFSEAPVDRRPTQDELRELVPARWLRVLAPIAAVVILAAGVACAVSGVTQLLALTR